ncbi:hypothetical protein ACFQV4_28675 [Streptomyces thermocarboxydus]
MKAATRTVRLGLTEPLRISCSTMAARDAVWLSVEHGGVTGHGEAVTSVYYGLDTATLHRCFADVAQELRRYPDPAAALESLRSGELAGGTAPPAVRAAVESALLDLVGIRAGRRCTGCSVSRSRRSPRPPVRSASPRLSTRRPRHARSR